MITVSTDFRLSCAFDVSSRNSDSGVVMRMSAGALWNFARSAGGRVAGAHRDRRRMKGSALRGGHVRNPRKRRAQVALDVHRERLERRNVEHAAALQLVGRRVEHQAVERPQERGQRLAAARRRQDQRRFAARNRRPPALLRRGRAPRTRRETTPAQPDENRSQTYLITDQCVRTSRRTVCTLPFT